MLQPPQRPPYSTVEPLEQRIAPAAFVVMNLADNGPGSLRQAILAANSQAGADTITFSLSGTIRVLSALPVITETLNINALATGSSVRIELDGSSAGADADGLKFISANPSHSLTVRGLAITRFAGDGVEIIGGGAHVLANDYFGVSVFAPKVPGGNGGNGVLITDAATFAIGDAGGNVISGNGLAGIAIRGLVGNVTTGASATINNNYIGTNSGGLLDVGNGGDGVSISVKVGSNIFVGTSGNGSAARNLISGNGGYGVRVTDDGSVATSSLRAMICVFGDFIGTDSSGGKSLGNDLGGIFYSGLVGGKIGSAPSSGNVISGNHGPGITISGVPEPPPMNYYKSSEVSIRANKIGTNKDSAVALSNAGAGVIVDGSIGVSIGAASSTDTQHDLERNIISGNVGVGVLLRGGRNNIIGANIIGLNASGQLDLGNTSHGIEIDRSGGFVIDGSFASFSISGNGGDGIFIHDTINGTRSRIGGIPPGPGQIESVFIGTDANGTRALGNDGAGIRILGSTRINLGDTNFLSGLLPGTSVISGNNADGIMISGSSYVSVGRVNVGTNVTGSLAVPNGGDGIRLVGSSNNTIGTLLTVISGNRGAGITLLDGEDATGAVISSSQNIIQRTYIGLGSDGVKAISNGSHGVLISGASANNTIGGKIFRFATGSISSLTGNVISSNVGDGIHIETPATHQNAITGNLIGTDRTGKLARGNEGGIVIRASTGERVGGPTLDLGNIVSGNRSDGLRIDSPETVVIGNFIGTDASGNAALGNGGNGLTIGGSGNLIGIDSTGARIGNRIANNGGHGIAVIGNSDANLRGTQIVGNTIDGNATGGVLLSQANGITVGGNGDNFGNVISGNGGPGLEIIDSEAGVVAGNTIGTELAPNGGSGIRLDGAIGFQIGGIEPATRNVLSGNRGAGITITGPSADNEIRGNLISHNTGAGVSVLAGTGQTVLANSIFANTGPGIDLGDDGPTANDRGDTDVGPNRLQNFATLRSVVTRAGQTLVRGTIDSTPHTSFRIEFFVNDSAVSEGQAFLDSFEVLSGASGRAPFAIDFAALPFGKFITTTVTDLSTNIGDTSEFSPALGNIVAPTIFAVGARPGERPEIRMIDAATGATRFSLLAYEADFLRGVRIATGDFDHDGFDDVIAGPGSGHSPEVKVFSGFDGTLLSSFVASGSAFRHGVFVAAEDLDGDGRVEVIVSEGRAGVADNAMARAPFAALHAFDKTRPTGLVSPSTDSAGKIHKIGDDRADLLRFLNVNPISKIVGANRITRR